MVKIKKIKADNIFSKTALRGYSYVINPYIGCTGGCIYCYACFMQKFTNHDSEKWGEFIDVKRWDGVIRVKTPVKGRNILMSTVTDPYLPEEKELKNTRYILKKLDKIGCNLTVWTRSDLVLRDLDILKHMDAIVVMPVNTLDETFLEHCENTTSIGNRLETLKKLHDEGIYTTLCISPIFPYITDFKKIIKQTKPFIKEYWFENLNLRQPYKENVLLFIEKYHNKFAKQYIDIYLNKNTEYWHFLEKEIIEYCEKKRLAYKIDFRYN